MVAISQKTKRTVPITGSTIKAPIGAVIDNLRNAGTAETTVNVNDAAKSMNASNGMMMKKIKSVSHLASIMTRRTTDRESMAKDKESFLTK